MKRIFSLGSSNRQKRRLVPTASSPSKLEAFHPLYTYAKREFQQTVAPLTSNDDGQGSIDVEGYSEYEQGLPAPPSSLPGVRGSSSSLEGASLRHENLVHADRYPFQADLPDAAYEEYYGNAYSGAPLKYIYPNGYQSLRPRSCPWKLSIFVCLFFTWLSIFIIDHCSDMQSDEYGKQIDDDAAVIDMRWCGSRTLYSMWVLSMLITGLSAAYCGIIGYIKVRDFAVANSRSQPPGICGSKNDYYVNMDDPVGRIYQEDGMPQFWGAHIYKPTQAAVAVTSR